LEVERARFPVKSAARHCPTPGPFPGRAGLRASIRFGPATSPIAELMTDASPELGMLAEPHVPDPEPIVNRRVLAVALPDPLAPLARETLC